ncbi:hypothetical protein BN938_2617 [Mucinivorans hirudinis]|uniref:Uncharacterized protein n=1 Tax=Mucinivorans hirudinis TaxID=1433126 RepID=A0A060RAQ6_9BACT|nr:hypothetical protein BN938_2617 [Mucinivorans hirudinis]
MSKQELKTANGGIALQVTIGWFLLGLLVSELNDTNSNADFERGAADARKWLGK